MAKTFYTADEAAAKLGVGEDQLTQWAREGKLREFRDAGKINYKSEEVDALAAEQGGEAGDSGELVLEPAEEDSGLELMLDSGVGSDVLSIEDTDVDKDADKTAAGTQGGARDKEGTVVPSVGVSVFDDDELDEMVDPLAQTQVSEGGVGFEGIGSGSGILDLTRESDDTSLGAELLDEIVPAEEATLEMGDDTRAGLEDAISEQTAEEEEDSFEPAAPARRQAVATTTRVEFGPDAVSSALTAVMVVAVLAMVIGGMAATAMVRDVWPLPLSLAYDNMMAFSGGAAGLAIVAGLVTYFVGKRS